MAKPDQISTRNTDSKGRLTLGEGFENRTVIVEQRGDELVVRLARVIPETEAWLYANGEALASVRRGLSQAKAKSFSRNPPDLATAPAIDASATMTGPTRSRWRSSGA